MKREIVFVCTGNTCRSPMAEGLFQKHIKDEGLDSLYKASSAGLFALFGEPANEKAIRTACEQMIDLSDHCAVQLNPEIIKKAFLILTMTKNQKMELLRMFPHASGKIFTLSEYTGGADSGILSGDIPDPFGMDQDIYRATYKMIETYIIELISLLKTDGK